jgi:hypothetical protein
VPRLKPEDTDFDLDELEEAEYSEGQFTSYDGEIPPNGTIVPGNIKKVWWTRTQNDDPMLKVLFEADETADEYEGLPVWENMALTAGAKFKWAPFLNFFGITLREVKTKTFVENDDDANMGAPVTKIGTWEPDSDDSYCRIVISRERYQGEWQPHVKEWLPYDSDGEPEEDEPEDEIEEPEPPARGRGRTARAKAPAASASKARPPARGARRASSATAARKPAPAARGRRGSRTADAEDEVPF